jgi:nicotinamidase-related amidase
MGWREDLASWRMPLPEFEVIPSKTALLIVDMQYWAVHPDYGLAKVVQRDYPEIASYFFPRLAEMVIPNQGRLLSFFRQHGLRIVFITVGPELLDGSDLSAIIKRRVAQRQAEGQPATVFPKGTFEHSIIEELKPEEGELVINKTSFGAFNSTSIDSLLRNMGIESLVIAGVATDVCVETTARDAADQGYNCILVEDACATFDQASHEAALRAFAKAFGMVKNTDEVIAGFRRPRREVV